MQTFLSAAFKLSTSAFVLLAANAAPALAQSSWPEVRAGLEQGPSKFGATGAAHEAARVRSTLVGRVLGPDGLPAAGAVIVSSAGGQAVSAEDGSFELEIELPEGVESLQVTAFAPAGPGAGNLVASRQVPASGTQNTSFLGPFYLSAQGTCEPGWVPSFGGAPDLEGAVHAFAVFDDGSGPALYVGGRFTIAGGKVANNIAKWDGSAWSTLGSGVHDSYLPWVWALAVYDDGSGPALYAGGWFTSAGGQDASLIAKWDGSSWSALGSGIEGGDTPRVFALTVYDDGSGPALYAGGRFTSAGGQPAGRIAKWDGSAWSALGSGISGDHYQYTVRALAVYDDGSGPALYVGGDFVDAGGQAATGIAKWHGGTWSTVGGGMSTVFSHVMVGALAVHDDGSGPALYAGGTFTHAGGQLAIRIARWDGSAWSELGSGIGGGPSPTVSALTVFDDGSGPALFVAGRFTLAGDQPANRIAKWDGNAWSPLDSGTNDAVHALAVFDDGSGPLLYVGGDLTEAGGLAVGHIARWDGGAWSAIPTGLNGPVHALAVFDDGSGLALYAGGSFTLASGLPASRIAKWDGSAWSALGSGLNDEVLSLTVFDDGSGPALYAGGRFWTAGGLAANRIAKWDGSAWSALGGGLNGDVRALREFDDGSGPALFAGGGFSAAGGQAANGIAKWDGSAWSALGGALSDLSGDVYALTEFDDGSGPALYAGGGFQINWNSGARQVAKWHHSAWSTLGSGWFNGPVYALTVYDDGSGPALYAGGYFTTVAGQSARGIAKWGGSAWAALGSGLHHWVDALMVHDDGSGPALYAGGFLSSAGGQAVANMARWDGSAWSALGDGLSIGQSNAAQAFTVLDDGSGAGAALYVGGLFSVSPGGDSFVAKWGCGPPPALGTAFCFGDGSGEACPCGNVGQAGHGCANSAPGSPGGLLTAAGSGSLSSGGSVLRAADLVPNQFCLFFQGTAHINGGLGVSLGDGLLCVAGQVIRLEAVPVDSLGRAATTLDLAAAGNLSPGDLRVYQCWYRNTVQSPCGTATNLTNALEILWLP